MDGERTLTQGMIDAKIRPGGTVKWYRDATTNDSDKTFTVPTGKIWKLMYIRFELKCTATAGNRYLGLTFSDGANNIDVMGTTANITANQIMEGAWSISPFFSSNTNSYKNMDGTTNTVASLLMTGSIPEMYLLGGYTIRVWETGAVDAAADDLIVVLHYIEYDA